LPKSIWLLGRVSLFMDIPSEPVHCLLPIFMAGVLGASMLASVVAGWPRIAFGAAGTWSAGGAVGRHRGGAVAALPPTRDCRRRRPVKAIHIPEPPS